ncbi:MAG: DNA mismatch repair endonuclease MutL [Dehalococcoidales bacterium]|nr:DNA mismatch repair endonuclease MutL [Dehalococcoidales bacterium]
MPIQVLSEKVISQIAAGEVVERPASVVKELVENALDAGAQQIGVEVTGGGTRLIRITDDGCGIPAGEVATAFSRHATSKISSLDDLQTIATMGFRGEALPSIAAVAEVEIATRIENEAAGITLTLEDGVVANRRSEGRARGTTVTVRNLFRKIPARLKFLKSTATESSRIANVVSQYALCFPEVGFTLTVDGRTELRTAGNGNLIDSIIEVYGQEIARNMIAVGSMAADWQSSPDAIRISGMVGAPQVSRAGRNYLSFFVNRRWVNSRILAFAVEEAYHGLLMTGKHPVAVVNIELPPAELDVNIHPAKSEVKFRDEHAVFAAVQRAVRRTLVAEAPVARIEEVTAAYSAPANEQGVLTPVPARNRHFELPEPVPLIASLPVLRVLGQARNCYIVAEGPDGVYLIDQHAAHERVLFDQIKAQRSAKRVEVQGLLEPATFEVSPRQAEELRRRLGELLEFGFALEAFGERTYLVRAVPAVLKDRDWQGMLRELLDGGLRQSRSEENIIATIACHAAVRAGQALSDEEMHGLVRQLEQSPNPHTCPHGRPTLIHLSAAQLEREFGRA